MSDVRQWLDSLGLGRYADVFEENAVDFHALPELSEDDLKELGLKLGHRRILQRGIVNLDVEASHPSSYPPPLPTGSAGEAERRQLTVMFADLVGSTELSQTLDPEDLRRVNLVYQNAAKAAIERNGGFVARYMGDGVLAYFGYPQAHEDDAERALRAGLALTETVPNLEADVTLAVRVGIATGPVVVGDIIGDGAAQESPVVGETPNLAARLQGEAEPNTVVVSEGTKTLAAGLFELEALPARSLKGFASEVPLYRVRAEQKGRSRFAARSGSHLSPFVGRKEELELLARRWTRVRKGRGQAVLAVGEPGIGKSRLLQQLLAHVDVEDHETIFLQCSPYHQASALYPTITAFERVLDLSEKSGDSARLEALQRHLEQLGETDKQTVGLLAHLLSITPDGRLADVDTMDIAQRREQTMRSLVDYVCRRSQRAPVLCAFEDVHWADHSTQELIGRLVESVEAERVLLLATTRPGFEAGWADLAHVRVMSLSRLDTESGEQLAQSAASAMTPLPSEVVEVILSRAEGNPLFIEELTRAVVTSERTPTPNEAIPFTLQDSLMARLDASEAGKAVAQCASVVGRVFEGTLLSHVWDRTSEQLVEGLNALCDSGLVSRQGQGQFARYAFKHALIRDAAYETLLRSRRRGLHARIVEVLQAYYPATATTEPELLAYHLTEAGHVVTAIDYWFRAGERAAKLSANVEAIAHLKRALELIEALPDSTDRAARELDILVALGGPLIATEGFASPEVGSNYARAHELFQEVGDLQKTAVFFRGLWQYYLVRADLKTTAEIGEQVLALATTTNEPTLLVEAHFALGGSQGFSGKLRCARTHLEKSLEAYVPERDQPRIHRLGSDAGVFIRCYLSHFLWLLGYPDQARECMGEGVELARKLSHPFSVAMSFAYDAMLHQFCRDTRRTRERATATLSICSEHGFTYYAAWASIMQGWVLTQEGRTEDGIGSMRSGLTELIATGAHLRETYYVAMVAEALGCNGHINEAHALFDSLKIDQEGYGERWAMAEVYRAKSNVMAREPSDDRVEDGLRAAIAIAKRQSARSLELRSAYFLARRLRDEGQPSTARRVLEPVFSWFTEGLDTRDLMDAKALLEQLN